MKTFGKFGLSVLAGLVLPVIVMASELTTVAGEPSIACPSTDFHEFIKVFSSSEDVQRTFTKKPLRKKQFDFYVKPGAKPVVRMLNSQQIQFPIMPLK